LIYATPWLGGWIADRFLGQRKTAIIGILAMAFGHFMMASEALLFPALTLLIFGGGFFKTNTSAQVGMLYQPNDARRDKAYSIYYVGTNIGAAIAPPIVGTLGEFVGWHYGFGAAGVGMLIALATYIWGWKTLPAEGLKQRTKKSREPLNRTEWMSVAALIVLIVPLTLWWACYEQQGNVIALFADANTDRRLIPGLIDWQIPVTWFQAFNPFMIFAFTPLLLSYWARKRKESNSLIKMVKGCALLALSYVLIAWASWHGGDIKVSWLWVAAYFAVITVGELHLSPISYSLYSKVAPVQVVSLMFAGVLTANFLGGGLLQGWLGTLWETMSPPRFFLMIAVIGLVSGAILWMMEKPLRSYLKND
jgi:POT family proton-dependent oligopeptide transporter